MYLSKNKLLNQIKRRVVTKSFLQRTPFFAERGENEFVMNMALDGMVRY